MSNNWESWLWWHLGGFQTSASLALHKHSCVFPWFPWILFPIYVWFLNVYNSAFRLAYCLICSPPSPNRPPLSSDVKREKGERQKKRKSHFGGFTQVKYRGNKIEMKPSVIKTFHFLSDTKCSKLLLTFYWMPPIPGPLAKNKDRTECQFPCAGLYGNTWGVIHPQPQDGATGPQLETTQFGSPCKCVLRGGLGQAPLMAMTLKRNINKTLVAKHSFPTLPHALLLKSCTPAVDFLWRLYLRRPAAPFV